MSSFPREAALQLQREIDELTQRHRTEVGRRFEEYFHQMQDETAVQRVKPLDASVVDDSEEKRQSEHDPPALLSSFCEPPGVVDELLQMTPVTPVTPSEPRVAFNDASPTLERERCSDDVGKSKTGKARKSQFLLASKSTVERMIAEESRLKRITESRYYEWFSGVLILLNSIFIGIQTEYLAWLANKRAQQGLAQLDQLPGVFIVAQSIFTVLFLIELTLRWTAEGFFEFFKGEDRGWNMFDTAIVSMGMLDMIFELAMIIIGSSEETPLSNFSILRVLRIVRIVRVVRIIRVMRFFRELRMMIVSTLGCLKSIVWVIMVLGLVFYIFAISFTTATSSHLTTSAMWLDAENADMIMYFGSVGNSVLSLYQAMSGGNDWAVFYDELVKITGPWGLLFLLYITFSVFAVVNIVTGVFVDSAMQSGRSDKEVLIHEELQSRKEYLEDLKELFMALDGNGNGAMSRREFEHCLQQEATVAYFNAMKLDVRQAERLFDLLDIDQSGEITVDEFMKGCLDLYGEATTFEAKIMHVEVRIVKDAVLWMMGALNEMSKSNGSHVPAMIRPSFSARIDQAHGKDEVSSHESC